jgi:hypothetical protein
MQVNLAYIPIFFAYKTISVGEKHVTKKKEGSKQRR